MLASVKADLAALQNLQPWVVMMPTKSGLAVEVAMVLVVIRLGCDDLCVLETDWSEVGLIL